MNLLVTRKIKTENSTIGDFSIDGTFFSHCLEPADRGLTADMTLDDIKSIKVQNKTAVPIGTYDVISYNSPRWDKDVPLLVDVPGYAGVEIHPGNYPSDTDGCLLLGATEDVDFVGNSVTTVEQFYNLFFKALGEGEAVSITYQDEV